MPLRQAHLYAVRRAAASAHSLHEHSPVLQLLVVVTRKVSLPLSARMWAPASSTLSTCWAWKQLLGNQQLNPLGCCYGSRRRSLAAARDKTALKGPPAKQPDRMDCLPAAAVLMHVV